MSFSRLEALQNDILFRDMLLTSPTLIFEKEYYIRLYREFCNKKGIKLMPKLYKFPKSFNLEVCGKIVKIIRGD